MLLVNTCRKRVVKEKKGNAPSWDGDGRHIREGVETKAKASKSC